MVVTGEYGARVLGPVIGDLEKLAGRRIRLLVVENRFFGGNIAVAGLLVGADIRAAIGGDAEPAGVYLIPDVAVQGDTFLDEITLGDLAASAKAPVRAVEATAAGLLEGAAA